MIYRHVQFEHREVFLHRFHHALEPGLDWKMWCGPGPLVHYSPVLAPRGLHDHFPRWRNTWEFGGGMITDWGAHHIDIAQWALNADGGGPVEVRAPRDWETARRGAQPHAAARNARAAFRDQTDNQTLFSVAGSCTGLAGAGLCDSGAGPDMNRAKMKNNKMNLSV